MMKTFKNWLNQRNTQKKAKADFDAKQQTAYDKTQADYEAKHKAGTLPSAKPIPKNLPPDPNERFYGVSWKSKKK